ncbi:MAG: hypothetical protein RL745_992, partial [Actinomycetota bacterium]
MNDQTNGWTLLLILLIGLALFQGQPTPQPIDPPPLTQPGLRVLVVYESSNLLDPIFTSIRDGSKSRQLL